MKAFDFPGRGVGAFVVGVASINWVGFFMTGLDGKDLNLQAIHDGTPHGFTLHMKKGSGMSEANWPLDNTQRVLVGSATISISKNNMGIETLDVSLTIDRLAAGGSPLTVSPPPPSTLTVKLQGVRVA